MKLMFEQRTWNATTTLQSFRTQHSCNLETIHRTLKVNGTLGFLLEKPQTPLSASECCTQHHGPHSRNTKAFLGSLYLQALFYWTDLCHFQKPFLKDQKHENINSGYPWVVGRWMTFFLCILSCVFQIFHKVLCNTFIIKERKQSTQQYTLSDFLCLLLDILLSSSPSSPSWKHPENKQC